MKSLFFNILLVVCLIYSLVLILIRIFTRKKTITGKIKDKKNIDELSLEIKNKLLVDKKTSTHYWTSELDESIREKIEVVNKEILELIGPNYDSINNMNEIYVTAKSSENSDKSFLNIHTDSPFYPCDVYRFLICIEPSKNVTTIIPEDNYNNVLNKYEILGFDYAKTFHYIKNDESEQNNEERIVLKLHYSKSYICDSITMKYSKWTRELFVNNKDIMGINGIIMLLVQSIGYYSPYILFAYFILSYFYFFRNKKSNKLYVYIFIPLIIFIIAHFIWCSMFLFI